MAHDVILTRIIGMWTLCNLFEGDENAGLGLGKLTHGIDTVTNIPYWVTLMPCSVLRSLGRLLQYNTSGHLGIL
jgi:hypothetical protein